MSSLKSERPRSSSILLDKSIWTVWQQVSRDRIVCYIQCILTSSTLMMRTIDQKTGEEKGLFSGVSRQTAPPSVFLERLATERRVSHRCHNRTRSTPCWPPESGTALALHQETPYWSFEPYKASTCCIALDDTIENGCARFVLGSHRLGLSSYSVWSSWQVTGIGGRPDTRADTSG